jgi:two-component system, chemotaxis family, sensor kinase CheA
MQEYLGLFLDESRENLQALNASILDLERDPDDSQEALNVIFRVAHSLKGMSATMGFEAMAGLTHRMEEVLSALRDGAAPVTTSVTDVLFACLDTLEGMVNQIAEGGTGTGDTDALLIRLAAIVSGEALAVAEVAATQVAPAPPAPNPEISTAHIAGLSHYENAMIGEAYERGLRVHEIQVLLDDECMLKAARAYMVVQKVEGLGELIKATPPVDDLEREAFERSFVLWVASDRDGDEIRVTVEGVSEVATCQVVELSSAGPAPDAPPPADITEPTSEASPPPAPVEAAQIEASADPAAATTKRSKAAPTVRVGTDRLDSLMNLMGEMVIQRTRLTKLATDHDLSDLRSAVEEVTRVTNDLQGLVMKVRMMPVEAVFMRFPRMVRDLGNSLGKQLELVISGEDTELDRTVIDEIGDPLVHMLRNAVDHGLETPDERTAAGKNPVGTVRLSARHEGNNVVIEVSEDGRGINPGKLRDLVAKKGLMTRAQVDALSDQEAVELIFLPGFSTSEVATDISGRGVGMDAVRDKISGLNGTVQIHSEMGTGSRFTIRLPLTLAIIQALLVTAAGEVYALPLDAIDETVVIARSETRPVDGMDCMVLRDRVVPLVSLRDRLRIAADGDESTQLSVVVVKSGTARLGVVVDALIGQQDIVIKHLPEYLGDIAGVSGATILGDGSVALIVDVGALGARSGARA